MLHNGEKCSPDIKGGQKGAKQVKMGAEGGRVG